MALNNVANDEGNRLAIYWWLRGQARPRRTGPGRTLIYGFNQCGRNRKINCSTGQWWSCSCSSSCSCCLVAFSNCWIIVSLLFLIVKLEREEKSRLLSVPLCPVIYLIVCGSFSGSAELPWLMAFWICLAVRLAACWKFIMFHIFVLWPLIGFPTPPAGK